MADEGNNTVFDFFCIWTNENEKIISEGGMADEHKKYMRLLSEPSNLSDCVRWIRIERQKELTLERQLGSDRC